MRRAAGFTLLEVLMAVAILSMVLLMVHMTLFSTIAARERLESAVSPVASAQALTALLREELRGTVGAGPAAEAFVGAAPGAGGALLSFVTAADPLQTSAGLVEVAYRLQPSEGNAAALEVQRAQSPWQPETEPVRRYETILRGVQGLEFQYYNGIEWRRAWPSAHAAPPLAVRAAVAFPSGKTAPERYETTLWVPSGAVAEGATP